MTDEMNDLDSVLYGNKMPWLSENRTSEKFLPLLHAVKVSPREFPFHYEVKFLRAFDHKTKYYSKFILNETIDTISRLHKLISADENDHLKAYWINRLLEKKLKTRLQDIGSIIRERNYNLVDLNTGKRSDEQNQELLSNTFIIQLLKLCYMHVYLELQEAFKDLIVDILIVKDFYSQLLFEPVPDSQFLLKLAASTKTGPSISSKVRSRSEVTYFQSFTYRQFNTGLARNFRTISKVTLPFFGL